MTLKIEHRPRGADTIGPAVRHFKRRDLPEIVAIEQQSFPVPWTEQEFVRALRSPVMACVVAERDGEVVGYAVYEKNDPPRRADQPPTWSEYAIRTLAVREDWRRQQVGTELVDYLKDACDQREYRRGITALMSETNAGAAAFFAEQGFVARLVPRPFDRGEEDGYLFRWLKEWE